MNKISRYGSALFVIWAACISYSSSEVPISKTESIIQKNASIVIHFKAVVNGEPFISGKKYINVFDEPFSIEKFKFYFCKPAFTNAVTHTGTPINKNEYFLIDFTDSITCSIKLAVRPGKYSKLVFQLGVDSIQNVSGAQTGALDPAKGMFWTWNSGYVMAKLEGSSPVSNQPIHAIAYHIGGFREPNNTVRTITLPFPQEKELEINDQEVHELYITAEINSWFSGPHPIHIKEIPTCTTPGVLAKNISENYAGMFKLAQAIN
jgi:hypothetical protein